MAMDSAILAWKSAWTELGRPHFNLGLESQAFLYPSNSMLSPFHPGFHRLHQEIVLEARSTILPQANLGQ